MADIPATVVMNAWTQRIREYIRDRPHDLPRFQQERFNDQVEVLRGTAPPGINVDRLSVHAIMPLVDIINEAVRTVQKGGRRRRRKTTKRRSA